LLAAPGGRVVPAEVVAEAERLMERQAHDLTTGRR
ncbi:MAG: lipopolysaccharide heptosyltransferase I, partial [Mesorhizobium sp.]